MRGGFLAGGHGSVFWNKLVRPKFVELDVAWSRYAAVKGRLEPVQIRTILLKTGFSIPGPDWWVIFYEDNLHSIWQEKDLLTHQEAIDLVQAYYAKVADDAYRGMLQA